MKTSPWLKNHSDAVGESRKSRSRLRSEKSRRKSTSPTKKTRQKAPQTQGLLIVVPPKAPGEPRAIPQATCGPVHASVTSPVASTTVPWAISPAEMFLPLHQTLMFHWPDFALYVASSLNPERG